MEEKAFTNLCGVMDTLLGENGCPWDREQTHESLRPHLLEEAYEVADAIDHSDMPALREELGDLLLQVIMHSRIAGKNGHFTLADVMSDAAEKLIRRHTHIFGTDTASTSTEVEATWEANKNKEKSINTPLQNMQAVPRALPALARAQKIIKRSGVSFPEKETIRETITALESLSDNPNLENSGKILLNIAAILTKLQINAEFALTNGANAFINSFSVNE